MPLRLCVGEHSSRLDNNPRSSPKQLYQFHRRIRRNFREQPLEIQILAFGSVTSSTARLDP